jgi:hypothetical protein
MAVTTKKAPGDLAQALARARDLKPRLEAATDDLNRSIEAAEAALVSLQLGVRASTLMDGNKDDSLWGRYLAFGKESKAWRLLIEEGELDEEESWTVTPLVNASRELRLRAVELLPTLVQKLVSTAEAEIKRVEAAATAARNIVTALSSGGDK